MMGAGQRRNKAEGDSCRQTGRSSLWYVCMASHNGDISLDLHAHFIVRQSFRLIIRACLVQDRGGQRGRVYGEEEDGGAHICVKLQALMHAYLYVLDMGVISLTSLIPEHQLPCHHLLSAICPCCKVFFPEFRLTHAAAACRFCQI